MMKYRNTKTGVVIEVYSVIHGDWEPVEVEEKKPKAMAAKKSVKKEVKHEKPVND